MTNPRLIVLEEEEVARLQLIRRHEGNDLSPNDAALLEALAARYEQGRVLGRKERARFLTPPTQRSDSE